MIGLQPLRPPYIVFATEPIERRDAAGNSVWVDAIYIRITQPGSADTVVKIADEWIPYIEKMAAQDPPAYPPEWVTKIKARYELYKQGQVGPVDGTAIKNWPAASPAEVRNLEKLNILAVEDVAAANEELVARMGMGGRLLKQKAIDFLQGQKDVTPLVAALAAKDVEITSQKVRLATLEAQVAKLTELLNAAPAGVGQPTYQPPRLADLETRLAEAQSRVQTTDDAHAVDDVLNEELS